MADKHLIVAHYREDTSWISGLPEGWTREIMTKNDTDLPNAGREAGTYLAWIAKRYPEVRVDGSYAFVQGDPWAHGFAWDQLGAVDRFTPLGLYRLRSAGDGRPDHPDLPVDAGWSMWVGRPLPEAYPFTAGGQFIIPGRAILSKPHAYWDALRIWSWQDATAPWVLERIWWGVFAG